MTSQVFNFLWINLDLPPPPDPADGSIRIPLPENYVENVRKAGAENPGTRIVLWVDSKRLTERQMAYLQQSVEDGLPNVHLQDLREIPAYNNEPLYNEAEKNERWRSNGQRSTIWRQVDAAKILVSLQGDFDQSFFADLDHAHLKINSPVVQGMIEKHGLMIGSSSASYASIENQLWGFDRSRHDFFMRYYKTSLDCAYRGHNAWQALITQTEKEILKSAQRRPVVPLEEICLLIGDDNSRAEHPGHEWQDGWNNGDKKPGAIPRERLAEVFNNRSRYENQRAALAQSNDPVLTTVFNPEASPLNNFRTTFLSRMLPKVKRAFQKMGVTY